MKWCGIGRRSCAASKMPFLDLVGKVRSGIRQVLGEQRCRRRIDALSAGERQHLRRGIPQKEQADLRLRIPPIWANARAATSCTCNVSAKACDSLLSNRRRLRSVSSEATRRRCCSVAAT